MIIRKMLKKTGAGGLLLVMLLSFFVLPVHANDINTVEIWATIHSDGSATITEQWDLRIDESSNTEWYVAKHHLDDMEIYDLKVEEVMGDGTTIPFETLGYWNVDASREEKAQRCGLVSTDGGYEVCWGFGELGRHTYNVTYTITDIVKGYEDGDAMSYKFLSDAAGGVETLNIYLDAEDFAFTYPETRVWVFGYEAESEFVDGGIQVIGDGRFYSSDYAVVMLAFEPGLLSPNDQRDEDVESFIEDNKEGSVWEDDKERSENPLARVKITAWIWLIIRFFIFIVGIRFLVHFLRSKSPEGRNRTSVRDMARYSRVDYCREIPFVGDIMATYARLDDLKQAKEGNLIGCYLLKWIRTGQVEITEMKAGLLFKREEAAIRLFARSTKMSQSESKLYDMVLNASGKDSILQKKEFEKWSRKNYGLISTWLRSYKKGGDYILDQMGAFREVSVKKFFGLIHAKERELTAAGEKMTADMLGFKRYLEDFTLLNEREAREVELWDEYLLFAQLFGIAEKVSKQFKQLYPEYFTRTQTDIASGRRTTYDVVTVMAISHAFSGSMAKGYQSGRASSSSGSSSSGGGGRSSSSGGGRSSGGGGAGGR